ncbi:uncharacterized protein LOC135832585 isoform X2 [Planococcus citri]|uniref:uncharacterized protein LOC135832585 isoform X2 n=1 Tax=Planococcus citri TaxID=170843 RepID=UPI0031F74B47
MDFVCNVCNTPFSRKHDLLKHTERNKCSTKKRNCGDFVCEHCGSRFVRKSDVTRHIKKNVCFSKKQSIKVRKRKTDINTTILQFESNAAWKDCEEQRTLSKYSQSCGTWTTKTGKKCRYRCHRSGFVRTRLKEPFRKRSYKLKGSCKINGSCTAYMLYEESLDGKVVVKYNPVHSNHDLEIKHVPISNIVKENIAEKIKSGATLDEVLADIRDTTEDTGFTRTQLITKHELHNIIREKKIAYRSENPEKSVDAESVESIIEDYHAKFGKESPFKYYKEQGEIKDQLEEDDFLLVIMNAVQIDLMKQFGRDKICVASIQASNDYDFHLNSVLVVNELNVAVPVAHAISNKESFQIMNKFFEIIMQECGVICTNTFISDDFASYINAWMMVMEEPKNILLSHWHVDKTWRKSLNLVNGSKDLKDEVYRVVRSLMDEKNEALFPNIVTSVIDNFFSDPNTIEFGKFFEMEYSNRYEMWSFAFRKDIGMNTMMEIEAMHKELKFIYCRALKNKRLDMLVSKLLRMSRSKATQRVSQLLMESDSRALKKIRDQHQNGQRIIPEDVSITDCGIGHVRSQSNRSSYYVVKRIADECDCRFRCIDCGEICAHMYECTCDDYVRGYFICKHIHAFVLRIPVVEVPLEFIDDGKENDAEAGNLIEVIDMQSLPEIRVPSVRESVKEVLRQILENIERCKHIEEDEDDIKALNTLKQINKMYEMKSKRNRIST